MLWIQAWNSSLDASEPIFVFFVFKHFRGLNWFLAKRNWSSYRPKRKIKVDCHILLMQGFSALHFIFCVLNMIIQIDISTRKTQSNRENVRNTRMDKRMWQQNINAKNQIKKFATRPCVTIQVTGNKRTRFCVTGTILLYWGGKCQSTVIWFQGKFMIKHL